MGLGKRLSFKKRIKAWRDLGTDDRPRNFLSEIAFRRSGTEARNGLNPQSLSSFFLSMKSASLDQIAAPIKSSMRTRRRRDRTSVLNSAAREDFLTPKTSAKSEMEMRRSIILDRRAWTWHEPLNVIGAILPVAGCLYNNKEYCIFTFYLPVIPAAFIQIL